MYWGILWFWGGGDDSTCYAWRCVCTLFSIILSFVCNWLIKKLVLIVFNKHRLARCAAFLSISTLKHIGFLMCVSTCVCIMYMCLRLYARCDCHGGSIVASIEASPCAFMVVKAFYCFCCCMNVLLRMNAFSTFNQEFLFLTRVIVLIKELCIFMFSDIWWPRG